MTKIAEYRVLYIIKTIYYGMILMQCRTLGLRVIERFDDLSNDPGTSVPWYVSYSRCSSV